MWQESRGIVISSFLYTNASAVWQEFERCGTRQEVKAFEYEKKGAE